MIKSDAWYFNIGLVFYDLVSDVIMCIFFLFLLWLKTIRLVFSGENRKPEVFDQDVSLFVESWSIDWIELTFVLRQRIVKSSANSRGMFGHNIPSDISLIAIRERVTEIVDPCGTPLSWKKVSESVSEVFTWKVRWLMKFEMKSSMHPLAIILLSLFSILGLQAVSYALTISKLNIPRFFLLFKEEWSSFLMVRRLFIVLLLHRNPFCSGVRKLRVSMNHISWRLTIFSSSLHKVLSRQIGR